MRTIIYAFTVFITGLLLASCQVEDHTEKRGDSGFDFPVDSSTINHWIVHQDMDSIYRHSWDIWNMINQKTTFVQEGDTLLKWMTWESPQQILNRSKAPNKRVIALEKPRQFHAKKLIELDPAFYVSVQYNPPSAHFAGTNQYFTDKKLQELLDSGNSTIRDFPDSSITIKPVFYVISQETRYARIPVWKGPPGSPSPYPEKEWNSYVYIDLENESRPSGTTCDSTETEHPGKCTYDINDFIFYRLTKEEVKSVEDEGGKNIKEGDYAVLVAMHLTTKEIKRWTWQTYFWSATPDRPGFPSSAKIAAQRTFINDKAVRHYATTVAYQMIDPVQPYTGGQISGEPVYAFNPYLEAPFDFGPGQSIRLNGFIESAKGLIDNKYGVQTNCMSCHALAHYFKTDTVDNDFYIGNTYIDMNQGKVITGLDKGTRDSILVFLDKLKTDFLWSIPDIANGNSN